MITWAIVYLITQSQKHAKGIDVNFPALLAFAILDATIILVTAKIVFG